VPTHVDQALVLRVWDWSETSQTALLFTRERGMVRGLAKGSKRPRSPYSGGLEPLTRGELTVIVKPNTELANITAWDLQELFPALRRDLGAFYAGAAIVEMLEAGVTDHDPHPPLFDAVVQALGDLGPSGANAAVEAVAWSLLVEGGYRPELHIDVLLGDPLPVCPTYALLPTLGGFTRDTGETTIAGHEAWRTRADTLEHLRALARNAPAAPVAPATRERSARLLTQILRHVLGRDLPTVRSLMPERDARASPP
jgi:DNA repair protein RecO (recombination protein O)